MYIFESCLHSKNEKADIFAFINGREFNWWPIVMVFAETEFLVKFCKKKSCSFWFLPKRFRHSPMPIAFFNFLAHFLQTYSQVLLVFLLNCIGIVVIDRHRNFRQPNYFCRPAFGGKNWKPSCFRRATFTLLHFLGLTIQCMASHCLLDDEIWYASCIQILAEKFSIFPEHFVRNFCGKRLSFQIKFCDI